MFYIPVHCVQVHHGKGTGIMLLIQILQTLSSLSLTLQCGKRTDYVVDTSVCSQ